MINIFIRDVLNLWLNPSQMFIQSMKKNLSVSTRTPFVQSFASKCHPQFEMKIRKDPCEAKGQKNQSKQKSKISHFLSCVRWLLFDFAVHFYIESLLFVNYLLHLLVDRQLRVLLALSGRIRVRKSETFCRWLSSCASIISPVPSSSPEQQQWFRAKKEKKALAYHICH